MLAVKGIYDGKSVKLLDKLTADPDNSQKNQTILIGPKVEKEYFLLNDD